MAPRHIARGIEVSLVGERRPARQSPQHSDGSQGGGQPTGPCSQPIGEQRYPARLVRSIAVWSLLAALVLGACAATGSSAPTAAPTATAATAVAPSGAPAVGSAQRPIRLVALGDGYTSGPSAATRNRDSWPAQLWRATRSTDMRMSVPRNYAEDGQTSENVLSQQLPLVAAQQPDVVSVQVGVNDIVVNYPDYLPDYRDNLEAIFDGLLELVPAERIFALTTPNHFLTEKGRYYGNPDSSSSDVDAVNLALREVAGDRGINVIDIAPIYDLVVDDPSLVIDGGPDPSAHQYSGWAEIIGQRMRRALVAGQP
jgi:lysophospholipase L1-like esterase